MSERFPSLGPPAPKPRTPRTPRQPSPEKLQAQAVQRYTEYASNVIDGTILSLVMVAESQPPSRQDLTELLHKDAEVIATAKAPLSQSLGVAISETPRLARWVDTASVGSTWLSVALQMLALSMHIAQNHRQYMIEKRRTIDHN